MRNDMKVRKNKMNDMNEINITQNHVCPPHSCFKKKKVYTSPKDPFGF